MINQDKKNSSRADMVRKMAKEIEAINDAHYPHQVPRVPIMAAEWFLGLVNGCGLKGPGVYHIMKKFFSGGAVLQNLVIEAAANGISWRGDDYDNFKAIVNIENKRRLSEVNVDTNRLARTFANQRSNCLSLGI